MLRRIFARFCSFTRRMLVGMVMRPVRAVRRHWKVGVVSLLVLNFVFTVSGILENRFMPPPLMPPPLDTLRTRVDHTDRFWSPQNPYCHYTIALSLVDHADRELIDKHQFQKTFPPRPLQSTRPTTQSTSADPFDQDGPVTSHVEVEHEPEPEPLITEEQVDRAIENLRPVIDAIHKGAQCSIEKLVFPLEDHHATSYRAIEAWRLSGLLWPCGLAATRAIEAGNVDEGVQLLLGLLEMGGDLTHSERYYIGWSARKGVIRKIGELVGSGCLDAGHYRRIIRETSRLEEEKADYRSILERDYILKRDLLVGYLDSSYYDGDYRKMMQLNEYYAYDSPPLHSPWFYLYKSVPGVRTWLLRNHSRAWKRIIDTQVQPYPTAMGVWQELAYRPSNAICFCQTRYALTPRLDIVNEAFASGGTCRDVLVGYAEDNLLARALMLMAALEAYRLEHGSYPKKLDALVGDYLRSVPVDPFTDGRPFQYSVKDGKYLLYSVGPDTKDDGGHPLPGTQFYYDAKGDCVFVPKKFMDSLHQSGPDGEIGFVNP